jgi:hypothetical protein
MSVPWVGNTDDRSPHDGRTKFGRRAGAWYRQRIADFLRSNGGLFGIAVGEIDDLAAELVNYYVEDSRLPWYGRWVAEEHYRGRRYSAGFWTLDERLLLAELPQEIMQLRRSKARESDKARLASLDDWLRADIAGTLQFGGEKGGAPNLLPELRSKMRLAAKVRRRRKCAKCGCRFIRGSRRHDTCTKCRAQNSMVAISLQAGQARPGRERLDT